MARTKVMPVWAAVGAGWAGAWVLLLAAGGRGCWPPGLPAQPPGGDLAMMLDYSRAWLTTGNPFAALNPYPPLAVVLFAPLLALPFKAAYAVMSALTLAAFASVAAVLPLLAFPRADRKAVLLAALAGVLSYGLWFELRWGQFNVVAMACAAWGVYLFHRGRGPRARGWAYALFCAAIQLKLFPAIFVFLFAKDPRAWRENVTRWAALGAVNVLLLFALGPQVFANFLHSVRAQAAAPYVWAGNHSIQSFAEWTGRPELAPAFLASFGLCFAWALFCVARRPGRATFAGLALMSTFGTLLLPGVSHDYKLTGLALAFALFAGALEPAALRGGRNIAGALLLLTVCGLAAWPLFSYAAKPAALQNNAPFLLAGAGGLAAWLGLQGGGSRSETAEKAL